MGGGENCASSLAHLFSLPSLARSMIDSVSLLAGEQCFMQPAMTPRSRRRFSIVLVKPSHYDDGYVIQWLRSTMPSNSRAVVDALSRRAAERRILGPDIDIEVSAIDETNRRVPLKSVIARFARDWNFGSPRFHREVTPRRRNPRVDWP